MRERTRMLNSDSNVGHQNALNFCSTLLTANLINYSESPIHGPLNGMHKIKTSANENR